MTNREPHKFVYAYPRAALTVDCVVFGLDEVDLQVLLIQRQGEPFARRWALPGGFVDLDEELEVAARRELEEETGLQVRFLEQLYTFGGVHRDPRERVVTVAYYALVRLADHRPQAASDARDARWYAVSRLPRLAFDHAHILRWRATGCVRRSGTSRSASSCCRPNSRSAVCSTCTRRSSDARWTNGTSAKKFSACRH